jgi:hypothetical protein
MTLPGTWRWVVQPAIYHFRGTAAEIHDVQGPLAGRPAAAWRTYRSRTDAALTCVVRPVQARWRGMTRPVSYATTTA